MTPRACATGVSEALPARVHKMHIKEIQIRNCFFKMLLFLFGILRMRSEKSSVSPRRFGSQWHMTLSFLFLLFSLFSSKRPLEDSGGFLLLSLFFVEIRNFLIGRRLDGKLFPFFQSFATSSPNPIQNPGVYWPQFQKAWPLADITAGRKRSRCLLAGRPKIPPCREFIIEKSSRSE